MITVHSCVHLWARCLQDYNLTMHSRVQLGWNLYTVCCLKLAKARVIQTVKPNQCVVCMSVHCVHGTQGSLGMRLCPWPIFIFDVSLCLCTLCECDNEQKSWSLPSELQVGHSNYSWNVLSSPVTHWHLNLVLFHHVHYILNPHITSLYTSPLSCKLKWEKTINTKRLNTFPTHFQCTGYLHIQMLIQMPSHADSSIIVFNTVVPWIRLIFNPMP